ncbi:MAG: CRTAC1 family protein [Myxococcota bacterium]
MTLLLLACVGPPDDAAGDDSAPPAPVCDAPTLTLTQDLRTEDLPAEWELKHTEPGVALADVDGDGDLDGLVAWAGGVFGVRNDGTGLLTVDPTITIDDGAAFRGVAVAFADLDVDGDPDAYLGEYAGGDLILWNDGAGRFTSERLSDGDPSLSPWTGAFGDADGDGDLDLYVAVRVPDIEPDYVVAGTMVGGPNYLYVNEGGGAFVRDDSRVPQEDNHGLTFQAAWVDLDGDDDLDLYEANDWGFYVVPNRFLRNDGAGFFTADPSVGLDVPMYGMGVGVGDVEGDGVPELVVTNLNTPSLFRIYDGVAADATRASGLYVPPSDTNFTSWGTAFGDLDRNGCADVVVAYGRLGEYMEEWLGEIPGVEEGAYDPDLQSNVLLLNDCAGGFSRATGTDFDVYLERDRSVALGDLDGDGRADVVSVGKDFFRVWMAGGGCDEGVTVRLSQPGENPAGIGARVTVTAGGRDQVMWMLPSTTHSQSALELTFGLGEAADGTVSVRWPDGAETAGVAVAAGDVVTVAR